MLIVDRCDRAIVAIFGILQQYICDVVMDGYVMDFAALTAFVAVARTGSMTAAATALGLSQPGVSRQIQRLEDAVGSAAAESRGTAATTHPGR